MEYRFYLAILYSDKTSMKISKKVSHRLVLSKVEGEHRGLGGRFLRHRLTQINTARKLAVPIKDGQAITKQCESV